MVNKPLWLDDTSDEIEIEARKASSPRISAKRMSGLEVMVFGLGDFGRIPFLERTATRIAHAGRWIHLGGDVRG